MALGYVIAIALFGAGSALLVTGLMMVDWEARERAVGLKIFLKTGIVPATSAPAVHVRKVTRRRPAKVMQLHAPRTPQAAAAHALRRAYDSSRVRSASA